MKHLKKIAALALVLAMMLTVAVPVFAASGHKFTYKKVTVQLTKKVSSSSLTKKMKLKRKLKGRSCLSGSGKQYKYTRSGLTIVTDEKNGAGRGEYVYSIKLTKKTYKTAEGAKVGKTLNALKSIYGSKLKKQTSKKYYVDKGNDRLLFTLKGSKPTSKVKSIEYQ